MIQQLAYLAFEVSDLAAWSGFCRKILGLQIVENDDGSGFVARMDERAGRFFVTEGPADDLVAVGWQAETTIDFDKIGNRLQHAGFAVDHASTAQARARFCDQMLRVTDPNGVPVEVVVDPSNAPTPFSSELVPGGFVTGDFGLGHVVVSAPDRAAATRFYRDFLGFSLSDHIRCTYFGFPVDLSFWHCNGRHHSLAFGGATDKRLHHFMIEARNQDDVGMAWDRALRAKVPIANALGRHPNDKMFSYYGLTPSGFQFEFGHGGLVIDDRTWDPSVVHDRVSDWGHNPPMLIGKRQAPPPKTAR